MKVSLETWPEALTVVSGGDLPRAQEMPGILHGLKAWDEGPPRKCHETAEILHGATPIRVEGLSRSWVHLPSVGTWRVEVISRAQISCHTRQAPWSNWARIKAEPSAHIPSLQSASTGAQCSALAGVPSFREQNEGSPSARGLVCPAEIEESSGKKYVVCLSLTPRWRVGATRCPKVTHKLAHKCSRLNNARKINLKGKMAFQTKVPAGLRGRSRSQVCKKGRGIGSKEKSLELGTRSSALSYDIRDQGEGVGVSVELFMLAWPLVASWIADNLEFALRLRHLRYLTQAHWHAWVEGAAIFPPALVSSSESAPRSSEGTERDDTSSSSGQESIPPLREDGITPNWDDSLEEWFDWSSTAREEEEEGEEIGVRTSENRTETAQMSVSLHDREDVWNALLTSGRGMRAARERAWGSSPPSARARDSSPPSGRARGSSPPTPPSARARDSSPPSAWARGSSPPSLSS